jgi:VanZ family protein
MNKLFKTCATLFFVFIIWIVYSANTGKKNIFFDTVNLTPYGDKVGHFFLFGILTLIVNQALSFKRFWLCKNLPLGTVLVSVFVILEELSQWFFPKRTLDVTDLIADGLGIFVFTVIGYYFFNNTG